MPGKNRTAYDTKYVEIRRTRLENEKTKKKEPV